MLELFIDNKKVDVQGESLEAKVTYQFLDTYQPEALIGAHSKTITLPDTATNNTIFANFQERYSALILQDGSRTVLSGYATLDKVTSNGLSDKYELTLYDNLGGFFHNLKFKDDTDTAEKTLADMYYQFPGFNSVTETPDAKVITMDAFWAHNSWANSGSQAAYSDAPETVFTVVPGNFEMKNFSKEKMIYDETSDTTALINWSASHFFKSGSDDGSGSLIQQGGRKYVLVSDMEENTPYAMMNIPITQMPLGVRACKVIQACCRPVNNGGYTVNLDPDWFNGDNPYWTEMFILNKQPASEIEYSTNTSDLNMTYPATETTGSATVYSMPVSGQTLTPWTTGSNNIYTSNIVNSVEYKVKFKPRIQVTGTTEISYSYRVYDLNTGYSAGNGSGTVTWNVNQPLTVTIPSIPYVLPDPVNMQLSAAHPNLRLVGNINCTVRIRDVNTNQLLDAEQLTLNQIVLIYNNVTGYYELSGDAYELVLGAMGNAMATANTVNLRFELSIDKSSSAVVKAISFNTVTYVNVGWNTRYRIMVNVSTFYTDNSSAYGGLPFKCGWPAGQFTPTLTTKYNSATTVIGDYPSYSKRQVLGNLGSPLDWFIKYLRMFNLRVHCHKSAKIIDVMTLNNYIRKYSPEDLTDKIDFGRDVVKTRSIIDEAAIKWNVDPQKNESVERLEDFNVVDPFDRTIRIKQYGTEEYDYLNTEVKIGLEARKSTPFLVREKVYPATFQMGSPNHVKYLFGINQTKPLNAGYVDNDGGLHESEYNVQYVDQTNQYTVLDIDGDVEGTLVMRNGWKTIYKDECSFGSCTHTPLPIWSYYPSVQMVALAEKPCYLGGVIETGTHTPTYFTYLERFNCPIVQEYQFPVFGNAAPGGYALTYKPEAFESINSPQDIYTQCFQDFIEKTYLKPEVVQCYVFLDEPEMRRLYWFDNRYWILSKIEDYDAGSTGPTKCTFVRYRTEEIYTTNPVPEPVIGATSVIGQATIGTTFMVGTYQ